MPRLRVLTTCPGTDWFPGQVLDATAEQTQRLLRERRAELVRDTPIERADERWRT
jgi:hypothetical protein